MFENLVLDLAYLGLEGYRAHLVTFGEDDGERYLALSQFEEEVHVDLAYVMTRIDKDEEHDHLFREVQVVSDHLFELLLSGRRHLGVSVARKVDEIPLPVDEEVVHKSGLSRLAGGHCKILFLAEHVDERGLAYVRSSDEGEFRKFLFRLLGNPCAAAREKGLCDLHKLSGLQNVRKDMKIQEFFINLLQE